MWGRAVSFLRILFYFPLFFFSSFQSSALGVRVPSCVGVRPRGGEISNFRKKNSPFSKHLLSVCHVPGTLINPEETPGTVVLTVGFHLEPGGFALSRLVLGCRAL